MLSLCIFSHTMWSFSLKKDSYEPRQTVMKQNQLSPENEVPAAKKVSAGRKFILLGKLSLVHGFCFKVMILHTG